LEHRLSAWELRPRPRPPAVGFSHPATIDTPYRVINYRACNSSWNDPALRFDHKDFLWCPRHKDTPRQFESTRLITAEQMKAAIAGIPAFLGRHKHRSRAGRQLSRGTL
jgi:hypothetical protein